MRRQQKNFCKSYIAQNITFNSEIVFPTEQELEVDMENGQQSRWGTIRDVSFLVALFIAAIVVPFILAVSESAKVFILGIGFLGIAVFCRRILRQQKP